ncbi:hypothetical protein [Pontibacter sp. G13]|uniref:hypothetical protein n=1 Tax=Pontibacter sp. G13 TaxID=3074898 RepID=UPI00288BFA29|nr:hypothetical protein [Pontibacter sp. G13]WNJ16091.1 hypothetical protein RJD25_14605 [Pontibacter sp. G13]
MRSFILLLAIAGCLLEYAMGQSLEFQGGTVSVSHYFYNRAAGAIPFEFPRQPNNLIRFQAQTAFKRGNDFYLPVQIRLNNNLNFSPLQPSPLGNSNFWQYIAHPGNRIYLGPRYKSFQGHIGSHIPIQSELSVGDQQIFGLGGEFQVRQYKIMASVGTARTAVPNFSFGRSQWSFRIEQTIQKRFTVGVNLARFRDQIGSVENPGFGILPQQTGLITVDVKGQLNQQVSFEAELGQGSWAPNSQIQDTTSEFGIANALIPGNFYKRSGMAGKLKIGLNNGTWGGDAKLLYIGHDYRLMAFPQRLSDRLDVLVSPWGHLFDRKLSLSGSVGLRLNNLSLSEQGLVTRQLLANISGLARPTDYLDISFGYANFGVRNTTDIQGQHIQLVANSLSIVPSIYKQFGEIMHRGTLTYSLDAFNDLNTTTGQNQTFSSNQIALAYSATQSQWIGGVTLATQQIQDSVSTGLNSITVNGQYEILKGLRPTASLTIMDVRSMQTATGLQLLLNLGATYRWKQFSGSIQMGNHNFAYRSVPGVPRKNEFTLYTTLQYRLPSPAKSTR